VNNGLLDVGYSTRNASLRHWLAVGLLAANRPWRVLGVAGDEKKSDLSA